MDWCGDRTNAPDRSVPWGTTPRRYLIESVTDATYEPAVGIIVVSINVVVGPISDCLQGLMIPNQADDLRKVREITSQWKIMPPSVQDAVVMTLDEDLA